MNLTFFCQVCGVHLRKGNHDRCKAILRKRMKSTEGGRENERRRNGAKDPDGIRFTKHLPNQRDSDNFDGANFQPDEIHVPRDEN